MFNEITGSLWDCYPEPPKTLEETTALWRDYCVAVGMLLTMETVWKQIVEVESE